MIIMVLDFYYGDVYDKYLEKLIGFYRPVINQINPCSQPINYSIGQFDKTFGVSEEEFFKNLSLAEAIWEKPLGNDFFNFSESGALKINLIYDYRQQATDELKKLGITIDNSQDSYNQIKASYESLIKKYNIKKAALDKIIKDFNVRQSAYEQRVQFWNNKGGAPSVEFQKLEVERNSLNDQAKKINQEQTALKKIVDEINAAVNVMNRLVRELNLKVDNYNTIGADVGKEFKEGEYVRDVNGERINIYQFDSKNKLIRVLAHEFGHALGLEHNDNPDSIMYRLNEGMNEKLSADDIKDIQSFCKIR